MASALAKLRTKLSLTKSAKSFNILIGFHFLNFAFFLFRVWTFLFLFFFHFLILLSIFWFLGISIASFWLLFWLTFTFIVLLSRSGRFLIFWYALWWLNSCCFFSKSLCFWTLRIFFFLVNLRCFFCFSCYSRGGWRKVRFFINDLSYLYQVKFFKSSRRLFNLFEPIVNNRFVRL